MKYEVGALVTGAIIPLCSHCANLVSGLAVGENTDAYTVEKL